MSGQAMQYIPPSEFHHKHLSRRRRICIMAASITTVVFFLAFVVGVAVPFLLDDDDDNGTKHPIRVGAFNIKSFGVTKMSNDVIAGQIAKIVQRYDIIVIQEVRDSTGAAVKALWTRLNMTSSWGVAASGRLGRSTYKEQYVFFYKTNAVHVLDTYQYDDSPGDVFEREPFVVEIEYHSVDRGAPSKVALLVCHTRPVDTFSELQQLPNVIHAAAARFPQADGVISMGDFNADCSYLSNANKAKTKVLHDTASGFVSLIPDTTDTTVASTDCAYDRIVVYGSNVRATQAHAYAFEHDLGLDSDEAYDVSDHYPVEFFLY